MFKERVLTRQVDSLFTEKYIIVYTFIKQILTVYPEKYMFQKSFIYYDSKASSHNHFLEFFCIAQLLEHLGHGSFYCLPLRRSWSPRYMQVYARIL
ncbi:hypothetical protein J3Q64DRAFT_1645575 [Phycomyces blakesleeanus]|uniref:Uncharacterized protein n=1 Tax=Phycomyces blakesleeanus TaxID=4837 RepID=A0ABR3ANT2_PHYBL